MCVSQSLSHFLSRLKCLILKAEKPSKAHDYFRISVEKKKGQRRSHERMVLFSLLELVK